MTDLSTSYLGLRLRNPVVCSSSPLCEHLGQLQAMDEAGAGAIVLHSLFEEQIERESLDLNQFLDYGAESYAESLSYLPDLGSYHLGPDGYLDHIQRAKQLVNIPIIASLNAESFGGWTRYARLIQEAGADALELNVYRIPTARDLTSSQIEQELIEIVRAVASEVDIPLAVKLSPFYTAPAALAEQLHQAGAAGLVLFNRFYQPDFDIDALEVKPELKLSQPGELLLRLHWIAILFGEVPTDLAVTGGVHSERELIKAVMAGAAATMMTSALLENGIDHIRTLLEAVRLWMQEHHYESIEQMRGSMSMRRVSDPSAFERGNYLKVLRSYRPRSTLPG